MRILHLTLNKVWFDEIASGRKKIEYREMKDYWLSRLLYKEFDEIHFKNGYRKDSPFMRVELLKIVAHIPSNKFLLYLGDILEVKNYEIQ